ncbi:formate dehydrogenase accessory sulfurtransferase FdhD [Desulfonatronum parangueonense]
MNTIPSIITSSTIILTPEGQEEALERVLREQPVEVALNERVIGSAMVLAENLEEFGAGFLYGQGYVTSAEEIVEVVLCEQGRVTVYARVDDKAEPETIVTSGCGGTGRISRKMLEEDFPEPSGNCINFSQVGDLIRGTLNNSTLSQDTHCVHACGYWADGRYLGCFEDVGRHNAVDKVIGAILLGRFPTGGAIYTTGRLTSDMVLKCARIGIPIVLSRSSLSSLGLEIAKRAGLTLAGYARPNRLNVFHAPWRITNNCPRA